MSPLPIHLPIAEIADFCRRHRIARLSLFGSVLRDDFSANSDVDVLVEFLPGMTLGSSASLDCKWNSRASSGTPWI